MHPAQAAAPGRERDLNARRGALRPNLPGVPGPAQAGGVDARPALLGAPHMCQGPPWPCSPSSLGAAVVDAERVLGRVLQAAASQLSHARGRSGLLCGAALSYHTRRVFY